MTQTQGAAGDLIARIRASLPLMSPSDARVAKAVIDAPGAVIHQSVTEFAAVAQVSTATVVRCTKKLGLKGFHDLKLTLAQELAAFQPVADTSATGVLARVTAVGAESVRDAGALITPELFDSVVATLSAARRILVVGVGTSAPLAQDAAYRLRAIGLDSEAPVDAHVQHVAARLLQRGDVCLAVSHTGSTRETLATVEAARRAGARVVLITTYLSSPIAEVADAVLTAGSREVSFHLEALASRLAHLVILDALLVALAERDPAHSQRSLDLYSEVLTEHRL